MLNKVYRINKQRFIIINRGDIVASKNKFINSIKRAVKILELYDSETKYLGITDMSKALDLNKSTTYRIVNTLKDENLLVKNEENQKYRVGCKILNLASNVVGNYDYKSIALEKMREIRDEINETVILSVYTKEIGVCLDKIDANNSIKLSSKVGEVIPLHGGATGKVLLAYIPDDEAEKVLAGDLEKYTENTITDVSKLKEQIKEIKNKGYVISHSEVDKGCIGVGAPILDSNGKLIYGLSVAGPISRIKSYGINDLVQELVSGAEEISKKIKLFKSLKENY